MKAKTGFGISDAVIRSARPAAKRRVERWRDLEREPGTSATTTGLPFALLWETYELASESAGARYRIDITIRPREHAPERPLLARIVDARSEPCAFASAIKVRSHSRTSAVLLRQT